MEYNTTHPLLSIVHNPSCLEVAPCLKGDRIVPCTCQHRRVRGASQRVQAGTFLRGGDASRPRDICAVVDRMIVTTIAKIMAWEPEIQDGLLEEEGGATAGLGHVYEYNECLQHFVQVAGSNHAPNGGGVPPLGENEVVCVLFKAVGIARGAATAVIAASRHITELPLVFQ